MRARQEAPRGKALASVEDARRDTRGISPESLRKPSAEPAKNRAGPGRSRFIVSLGHSARLWRTRARRENPPPKMTDPLVGEIVEARVVAHLSEGIAVDVGLKADGLIPLEEFEGELPAQESRIPVLLLSIHATDGTPLVSYRKAKTKKILEELEQAKREGTTLQGKVVAVEKSGLRMDVGMEAFMPLSHAGPGLSRKLLIGKILPLKVLELDFERENVIVSHRKFLEEDQRRRADLRLTDLREGDLVEGVVQRIMPYGAFVEVDGLDGLLHKSDLAWRVVEDPKELLTEGQKVKVRVLKVDHETRKVSLGLKQAGENPWEGAVKRFPARSRTRGKVLRFSPRGAFVLLEGGLEGFIRLEDFSWGQSPKKAQELFRAGEEVETVVLSVDSKAQKIFLGIRQKTPDPFLKYKIRGSVSGVVKRLTDFGAFVELEPGIQGMVHVSEIDDARLNHPNEKLAVGALVEAEVIAVDLAKRKLSLSIKKRATRDSRTAVKSFLKSQSRKLTLGELLHDETEGESE